MNLMVSLNFIFCSTCIWNYLSVVNFLSQGICDFQYLPASKQSNGSLISVKDKIFPVFGSADNPEKLVMKDLINEEVCSQAFSLPPAMSRIDNPPVCNLFMCSI